MIVRMFFLKNVKKKINSVRFVKFVVKEVLVMKWISIGKKLSVF